jgi:hypothetical protein
MRACQRCGAQYDHRSAFQKLWHDSPLDKGITRCQTGLESYCEADGCLRIIRTWQMFCETHQGGNLDALYGDWMGGIARQGEPDPASYGLS